MIKAKHMIKVRHTVVFSSLSFKVLTSGGNGNLGADHSAESKKTESKKWVGIRHCKVKGDRVISPGVCSDFRSYSWRNDAVTLSI